MFCGPKFGMLRKAAPAAVYSLATLTSAEVATILGKAEPDHMYRYDEASGATDLAGTDDLSDASSPTKQESSTALGIDTTRMSANSLERTEAASSSVGEAGTGTVSIIHIYEMITVPAGNYQIFGKRGTFGYEVFARTTGQLSWVADSTAGAPTSTVAVDHGTGRAEVILCKRSETDNESGLYTQEGSAVFGAPGGDMTDAKLFSIGRNQRNAAAARHGLTLIWEGANGDGFGETERSAMAVALGFE